MHVLMVSTRFMPEMGGIETHVHEVSRRLGQYGVKVEVLTTDRTGTLPPEETIGGVHVRRVRAWPKQRDYYLAPAVYHRLFETDCDVVHVQGYHTFVAPLAMFAAIRKKVPFVLTFHSGGHSSRLRNLMRLPQRRMLAPLARHAAHCVGVSRFEADFFGQRMGVPRTRWSVIPNGAQMPDIVAPAPGQDDPLIVSIGRLERYKGHQRILEAFPAILRTLPTARLRIMGEGPYKSRLVDLAASLGLSNRVTIGGVSPLDRIGVARTLASASLVVLLSDYEAHPVAVMEAIALRRRVLVTDCSGFREMVDHDVVRSVPLNATPGDIALAAIAHLGKGPLSQAIDLPTWDDCAKRLTDVYRSVVPHHVYAETA